eukprot:773299-Prymnesium_polylepis.1
MAAALGVAPLLPGPPLPPGAGLGKGGPGGAGGRSSAGGRGRAGGRSGAGSRNGVGDRQARIEEGLAAYLCCAACGIESSGEAAFIQHINGKAHEKRAGRRGFAGLRPNTRGVIPALADAGLRFAAAAAGFDPNGSSDGSSAPTAAATLRAAAWAPPVRKVVVSPSTEGIVSAALRHASSCQAAQVSRPPRPSHRGAADDSSASKD